MQKFTKTQVLPPSAPILSDLQNQKVHLNPNTEGRPLAPKPPKIKTIPHLYNQKKAGPANRGPAKKYLSIAKVYALGGDSTIRNS
jgi:hypothetical protein